nr:UPF0481 protein At3g47200-like [Ziziphus jujuba var. spinosa]
MEHRKTKHQQEFWKRDFCKHIGENDIEDFMRQEDRRQRIWDCYAGTFELRNNPDLFFSVILRDALFIFELFLRNFENQLENKKPDEVKDYILRTPWLRNVIELDLILLENQLPFFIFTELFDFILQTQLDNQVDMDLPFYLSKHGHPGELAGSGGLLSIAETRPQFIADDTIWGTETNFFKNIKHFTDMVRKFLCPTDLMVLLSQPAQPNQPPYSSCYSQTNTYVNYNGMEDPSVHYTTCFYSAKQLDRAGIEDNTECLMRNVMALEQCVYPFQSYICDYIWLLDHLINTAEDVELLVEKRIVENLLGGNDAVADLVNKLCDQIVE